MRQDDYELKRLSFFRRSSLALYEGVPESRRFLGLLEVDVTELRKGLREGRRRGEAGDLFAALVLAVARTLEEFPEFNAMRCGSRVAMFRDVDVNVPVQRRVGDEELIATLVIRSANRLGLAEISRKIADFKAAGADTGRRNFDVLLRLLLALPPFLRRGLVRSYASSPARTRASFGTTLVTAVGQGAESPGWIIPLPTGPIAASFALGPIARKPRARGAAVEIREILHLTVSYNHDLVDGSPAARFTRRLVGRIEGAEDLPSVSKLVDARGDASGA